MGNLVFHLLAFIVVPFICIPFVVAHSSTQTSKCSQIPNPEHCHSIETQDKTGLDISKSTIGFTLTQAQLDRGHIKAMNVSLFNKRARQAWTDCLELYDDMVFHLNRSLRSHDPTSSQTWLSAAMTNHQTCQNGFTDFHLSSHLRSFPTPDGLSELLSNSLAINKNIFTSRKTTDIHNRKLLSKGFPNWLSKNNRELLESPSEAVVVDIIVAKDGSGNYKTITEAVAASGQLRDGSNRFVIHVKAGVYQENIVIEQTMENLMFVGDGIDNTIVTSNKNVKDGSTTFRSATFAVTGNGFIARDMTFENTAGPQKHQAVALRSGSDFSIFYRCSFKGYQDTLYLHTQRQFYRECDIYGTIDFIFGNAAAVLQNCNIYVRKPLPNQKTTITAQSRSNPNMNTGFVIQDSNVTAGPDMNPVQNLFKNYLGRPWKEYSRVVFMKCVLDTLISPAGWLPWNGSYFGLDTLYYGEYLNKGVGADTNERVMWEGHHVIMNVAEARKFTIQKFFTINEWIVASGVPFTYGL